LVIFTNSSMFFREKCLPLRRKNSHRLIKYIFNMEQQKSSRATDWMLFGISLVVMLGFLYFLPEWFWVVLPFVGTYWAKGMDYI
jgi:hypothetical protein